MSKTTKKQPNKTLHIKKSLLEALQRSLGVVTTACNIVGVSRRTYYDYYNGDAEFRQEADDIANITLDFAESKLHKAIEENNVTAIIFYLKTKGKDRGYVERTESHYTNTGNNFPEWLEDEQ
jgi:hypothetical protein